MNFFKRLFGFQEVSQKKEASVTENDENQLKSDAEKEGAEEVVEKTSATKLTLVDAQTYTHQGKREYQEDNAYIGKYYLIVSDGMGGHAKGDVASEIVVETLVQQLAEWDENDATKNVEEGLQTIIETIIVELNNYVTKEPIAYKMGATLVMALLIKDTLYAIHIGDSRIYLFDEQGGIKFVTKDHSFVQELIDAEVITPEDALTHPRRNVITRVLQAKEGLKVKATINILEQVSNNDKLLLCSDGVTEACKDNRLSVIFGQDFDNSNIVKEIQEYCAEHSSDNNTAIVATINL